MALNGPRFAGENGKNERICETAPDTAERAPPIAFWMPCVKPLINARPEPTSHDPAPAKKPITWPGMLEMVFMRLPIWPDTAPTSAEKAPVTAAYTCCAAFAIVDTMVEKYPAIEETRPDTSESAEDTSEPTNATTAFTPPETARPR